MKGNIRKIIITIIAYLYLIIGYVYIVYNFSYLVRIANKPMGWAMVVGQTLLYIIAYVIINFVIIKRILNKKLLIVVGVLLVVTILALFFSDIQYEQYLIRR